MAVSAPVNPEDEAAVWARTQKRVASARGTRVAIVFCLIMFAFLLMHLYTSSSVPEDFSL